MDKTQRRVDAIGVAAARGIPKQALFLLLKFCVAPSLVYPMRSVPSTQSSWYLRRCGASVRKGVYDLLGKEEPEVDADLVSGLMFAPTAEGGLGIMDPVLAHDPAFLGQVRQTAGAVYPGFDDANEDERKHILRQDPDFTAVMERYVKALHEDRRRAHDLHLGYDAQTVEQVRDEVWACIMSDPRGVQKRLTGLRTVVRGDLMRHQQQDPVMKVVTQSARGPEASLALGLNYDVVNARLSDRDFTSTVLLRVGYPLLGDLVDQESTKCPLCGGLAGTSAWHATCCTGAGMSGHTRKHTDVEAALAGGIRSLKAPGVTLSGPSKYASYFAEKPKA